MRFLKPKIALICACLLLAASCSFGDDSETLTVYSGRNENLVGPILERFTEDTGIEVAVRYADSAELALLIEEEGDKSVADVFLSQSPGAIDFLDSSDRLAQLPQDVLALVPDSVKDADGRWVGLSGRQRVLVYNSNLVEQEELPSSIFDLVDDSWEGRIGVAPANGSFQDFVTAMRANTSDEETLQWLQGIAENDVSSFANNNAIVAAVGRGEIDAGLVNHYYNFRFLDEDPEHLGLNHQFDSDDPGSVLIVTGAAIMDVSDRSEDAAVLVEWLLGDEAQKYFADETFEYPLVSGGEPSGDVPPADFGPVGDLDLADLSGGLAGTRDLIAEAGLQG